MDEDMQPMVMENYKKTNLLIFTVFFLFVLIAWSGAIQVAKGADCSAKISIQVTSGNPDVVSGTVTGVNPSQVWVVVFVRTNRWYIQPYADARAYLPVDTNGKFETWIREWRQIAAFVIPKNYNALAEQEPYKPFPLSVDCANVLAIGAHPTIQFSGYEWAVKAGELLGPCQVYGGWCGNDFSASNENVWADSQGRLHLKITYRNGTWYCAEVYLTESLGHGTYKFQLSSDVALLDKNLVAGLFTYEDLDRELDIEFSAWGLAKDTNAQYVVQPFNHQGNREPFYIPPNPENPKTTHIIGWRPDSVLFQSAWGHHQTPPSAQIIHQWLYKGNDNPPEAGELVHSNLWLIDRVPPSDSQEAELVINKFIFLPLFIDVPPGHWAEDYIYAIYNAGITTGCSTNPLKYCPQDDVTRAQMAAFIVRAVEGEPAADYCNTGSPFADVPSGHWACKYIKRLSELGITTGCGGGNYCPNDNVTRAQMAAFLVRAVEGEPAANYCVTGSPFSDVSSDYWACKYIKRLLELEITTGCGGGNYCPNDNVTRAQMAAFLARAFLEME